jgi:hypothetical protein
MSKFFNRLCAVVVFGALSSVAQEGDTAYVPIVVNVDAVVKAQRGAQTVSINVAAETEDTLAIPLGGVTTVVNSAQNAHHNAPVITNNRNGKVAVNLPAQKYRTAEIYIYSVNGRRVLRTNASAAEAAKNISRTNLVPGVYLITVKGAKGHTLTNRITHNGGNLNISVSFGNENLTPAGTTSQTVTNLARQTTLDNSEEWTITVSAETEGYRDVNFTINVKAGMNPKQTIRLQTEEERKERCYDGWAGPNIPMSWVMEQCGFTEEEIVDKNPGLEECEINVAQSIEWNVRECEMRSAVFCAYPPYQVCIVQDGNVCETFWGLDAGFTGVGKEACELSGFKTHSDAGEVEMVCAFEEFKGAVPVSEGEACSGELLTVRQATNRGFQIIYQSNSK